MAKLSLLGGVNLVDDTGSTIPLVARRHPVTLLALVATAPSRTLSRESLMALLWPESTESRARSRLGTCVHQVRSTLGEAVLESVGGDLRLDCRQLTCDVCDFEDALASRRPDEAVELYRGPLLAGFRLPGGAAVERRIDRERDRLRRGFRSALEALAEAAERKGDPVEAAGFWRRLFDEDPLDSRVVRRLMLSLASAGNVAGAVRMAERYERRMAEDLGAAPADSVRTLAERLRSGDTVEPDETPSTSVSPSVAVLPFEVLGDAADVGLLAEGIHSDLLTELSRLSELLVIARSSVLGYRDSGRPAAELARELGVGAVVEGQVQQAGDRLRLSVQLVDADRGAQLWAERYDRRLEGGDMLGLQSQLTRQIARALEAELSPAEQQRLQQPATIDMEAYRLCVRGRVHLEQRSLTGMERAAELFRQAAERDSQYAAAWAGLAATLGLLMSYYHATGEDVLDEAVRSATRAIELDPGLAEAYVAFGLSYQARTEGPASLRAYRRAVELRPGYAEAHGLLAYAYLALGQHVQGIEHMNRAARLNPLAPETLWGLAMIASSIQRRPPEEALRHVRRALELSPGYAEAHALEGEILARAGLHEEALDAVRRGLDLAGEGARPRHLAVLVHVLAMVGRPELASAALRELKEADDRFYLAKAYAALGRIDDAFRQLEEARWDRPGNVGHLRQDLALEPVRQDPRFDTLITGVNELWGLNPDGRLPAGSD